MGELYNQNRFDWMDPNDDIRRMRVGQLQLGARQCFVISKMEIALQGFVNMDSLIIHHLQGMMPRSFHNIFMQHRVCIFRVFLRIEN